MRSIVPGSWALVALAACGASGTDGTRSPELVLDHVASWPAVATDIRAGAILDDSSIVVWNDSGAVWVGRGRGELVAVASPPLVLGRHVDVGTGLARGVDGETGEILTVNADGVVSDSGKNHACAEFSVANLRACGLVRFQAGLMTPIMLSRSFSAYDRAALDLLRGLAGVVSRPASQAEWVIVN